MENRTVTDAAQALQGKAAGVQISNTSGAPGSTANIQIRGYSSNARTEPLFIVDGLKVQNLNYLDPDNIESIEILKDGASAAIYGIEAGNGVILVTTKTGKSTAGQGRIFYNMQHASESLANMPALLNAEQYKDYMLRTKTVLNDADFYYDGHSDTKWVDRVTETGIMARHTVGYEGGNDRGSFFTSLASTNNDGIIIGDKDTYKRLTGQINADYKIKDWLQVGITTSIEHTEVKSVGQGANGILGSAINMDPLTPWTYAHGEEPASLLASVAQGKKVLTDENGLYYGDKYITGGSTNPAVSLRRTDASTKSFNTRGTAFLNFTPIKGLTLTSRFGYRAGYSQESTFNHEYYVNSYMNGNMSINGRSRNNLYYQWENFGSYLFDIGNHEFNVMAGMSYQRSESNSVYASADALPSTEPLYRYLEYAINTTNMDVAGILNENNNMSYFGRLGWTLNSKYDIQASFRADAYDMSKLDKDHRWGYFPSISGGWTISNESFMDNIKSKLDMSSLRLRASYGILGNVNALGSYQYASTLSQGLGQGYDFGNGSGHLVGVYPSNQLPNPDVVWETTRQLSMGFGARFLRDRLTLGLDVYNKNTYNLITRATAPANTGASEIYMNAGEVNNRGIDIELGWRDEIGDLSYSVNGNISYLKNKVTKGVSATRLDGARMTNMDPVTYFEEGYPIWYLRTYVLESIDPETGRAIYKDFDGKKGITSDDRIMTGKGIPDYTYGLTLSLGYKNFDLTVYGTGVQGIERLFALNRGDFKHNNTLLEFYEGMWTQGSTNSRFPLFYADDPNFKASDVMVFDASFFKIKQIQLGYNVPSSLLRKVHIQRLRAFVSLEDWFTFTKYPGLDPETSGSNIEQIALDAASYPMSKKVVFGLNVSF
jgi:TonB-linked SusC/RagA family outer membrane protein